MTESMSNAIVMLSVANGLVAVALIILAAVMTWHIVKHR